MKRILITGANSYIGKSFENYLKQWPEQYHVDTVDMVDDSWRGKDFAGYDTVFHVAGIAHIKERRANRELYYQINRDLVLETAQKAKYEGVKQFIFLSSMSIYGIDTGVITESTAPNPQTHYGGSKLQAEQGLKQIEGVNFSVAILRPPMVYGKGCKGNFQTLLKIARNSPLFPLYENKRSMIYIDNLSSFTKMVIDNAMAGVLFPQNQEYMRTDAMVQALAEYMGKKVRLSKMLTPCVATAVRSIATARKVFGSLIYVDVPYYNYQYIVCNALESLKRSV